MSEEKNVPPIEPEAPTESTPSPQAENFEAEPAPHAQADEQAETTQDASPQKDEPEPAREEASDEPGAASQAPEEEEKSENSYSESPKGETAPDMENVAPAEGGTWSAIFNGLAKGAPIILVLAMFCLAWHDFYRPDNAVYCPPEFRSITAFLHCVAQSSWLTPIGLENGVWAAPQWPGFLWFAGLLALIPGLGTSSLLLPVTEFIAAAIAVLAIWWLAHAAKFGSRAAFAAGLMALCCPLFAPLPHFMGPGALAAGFMLLALLCFYKGWRRDFSIITLPLAFIFTALAGLTGGILHFATPLLASCCFLIWIGKFKRAQRLDALLGFIFMLAIIGCWLGLVMIRGENPDYLSALVSSTPVGWPPEKHWWFALAAGILGSLPWLLTIFGVSWARVVSKSGAAIHASRFDNGSALIWCSLVIAAAISVWTPNFHAGAVAICSLLLILLGKAFPAMPRGGNRFFFFLAALITTLVGLALFAMHFEFTQNLIIEHLGLPVPDIARKALREIPAFLVIAAILTLGGLGGFYFVKRFCHCGGIVYALLLAILLCQPGRLWVVPELAADPALPVRHYDAMLAEVEKALSTQGSPSAQPATETPNLPAIIEPGQPETSGQQPPATPAPESTNPEPTTPESATPDAATPDANVPPAQTPEMGATPAEPPRHGSTVTPTTPPAQAPGQVEEVIILEKLPQNEAGAPTNEAPQIPAAEPESAPQAQPPAVMEQPGAATPESAAPTPPASMQPAQNPQGTVEELIIEKEKLVPDMPDHPVTGENPN